jgi:drug/metabolite transporter (DMT)-like permease
VPASLTDSRTGFLLAMSGVLLISLDSLWIRLSEAGSWDVAFWVGGFTFVGISIVLPLRTGDSIVTVLRRDRSPLVASSLLNTVSVTMFIVAVGLTTVANTVAIIAAAPVASAVVARLIIGEKPSTRTWWAIAGSVVGIMVIVSGSIGAGSVSGDVAAVVAVLAFAGNVTLWRRYPAISRLGVIGLGGLFTAIVAFLPAQPFEVDGRALAILAIMGLLTGPAGRVSLASSTRYLPAAQVGLFTPVETVAATAWAWLFLSEAPPFATVVGGVIVIISVLYGSYRRSAVIAPRS